MQRLDAALKNRRRAADRSAVSLIFGSAFYKPKEFTFFEKILAIVVSFGQFLWNDMFAWMFTIAVIATLSDFLLGTRISKLKDEYDSLKAELGLVGKFAGILIIMIVRGMEVKWSALTFMDFPLDTGGWVATAFAVGYIMKQLQSINEKRTSIDGQSWPLFDKFVEFITTPLERLFGGSNAPKDQ